MKYSQLEYRKAHTRYHTRPSCRAFRGRRNVCVGYCIFCGMAQNSSTTFSCGILTSYALQPGALCGPYINDRGWIFATITRAIYLSKKASLSFGICQLSKTCKQNTSGTWNIPWFSTRKGCITTCRLIKAWLTETPGISWSQPPFIKYILISLTATYFILWKRPVLPC